MAEDLPLGKARLDLEANFDEFDRGLEGSHAEAGRMQDALDALSRVSEISAAALGRVKIGAGQAAESRVSAEQILAGVRGVSEEAIVAARELDKVKLTETQATESDVAGDRIKGNLDDIGDKARRASRDIDRVKITSGRPGVGAFGFGSGFGRVGLLGTGIGLGALTAPAAAPAALGLLAGLPTVLAGAAGAAGTLALALDGVGKAIGGDKKAFDDLSPAAQQFVLTVRSLDGWFDKLRATAASNLFPGVTAGLKAALSPGTVNAITQAVTELARALGNAAAQWGRYFGSAQFQQIFGPLMQSAARNIGRLSDAALHLFDALGVLGRAAIPLVNWLTDAADRGAKLVDNWLKAKDASGQLADGMNEAKTSLQLVWNLFESLVRVVVALGRALYPVSKVAVKDLTDGLNWLANTINQNRKGLADFVNGALQAFVTLVKVAVPILTNLVKVLDQLVKLIGGWKTAFEAFFALAIASKLKTIGGAITGIGEAAGAKGAAESVGLLLTKLQTLAAIGTIVVTVDVLEHVIKAALGGGADLGVPGLGAQRGGKQTPVGVPYSLADYGYKFSSPTGYAIDVAGPGGEETQLLIVAVRPDGSYQTDDGKWHRGTAQTRAAFGSAKGDHRLRRGQVGKSGPVLAHPPKPTTDTSVFGTPPPFTKNVPKAPKPPVIPPLATHAESLASQNESKARTAGTGATARRYLENALADLTTAEKSIREKLATATGKARTQLFSALTTVLNEQRTDRARMAKLLQDDRAAQLQFAVDQAKDAAEKASKGSPAWERAIADEKKALRAEIAYEESRAKDQSLSKTERDQAQRRADAERAQLNALSKGIGDTRSAQLQFAVDQAKAAVAAATEGTAAYNRAVSAEEKALKAQIAYLNKIVENSHESLKARDAAEKKITADRNALKSLMKSVKGTADANEAQFLSSFAQLESTYFANAFPQQQPGGGKTDTHLYDMKHELRRQTRLLKGVGDHLTFPASGYAIASAEAALP